MVVQDDLVQPVIKYGEPEVTTKEEPLRRSQRIRCQEISNDYIIHFQEYESDVDPINFLEAIIGFNSVE